MHIRCKQNAYSIINGKRLFTEGKEYLAKVDKEDERFLLAKSDEGTWIQVSMRIHDKGFIENDIFQAHFDYWVEEFQEIS
ncbi:MAG TPA: hypothetical protein VEY51_19060 [Chondromyces sp.]|nr:hypothetical protein [Chondromyces sp.]